MRLVRSVGDDCVYVREGGMLFIFAYMGGIDDLLSCRNFEVTLRMIMNRNSNFIIMALRYPTILQGNNAYDYLML